MVQRSWLTRRPRRPYRYTPRVDDDPLHALMHMDDRELRTFWAVMCLAVPAYGLTGAGLMRWATLPETAPALPVLATPIRTVVLSWAISTN